MLFIWLTQFINLKLNIMKTKVMNMKSNKGNDIPNQFIITTEEGRYFQSYNSVIAFKPYNNGQVLLDCSDWNYSTTTSKYRNQFLNETTKETQKKIDQGIYKLVDLNE